MPEFRFHGRGGQGAVVASRVLAEAAFLGGRHVQAFPAFGLERRGAPVLAFTRVQATPILNHSQVYRPDVVVVLDASLLELVDVAEGLSPGGIVLINTAQRPAAFGALQQAGATVVTVNASAIAAAHRLGSRAQPIVNTAILGALARASGVVTLAEVEQAIAKTVAVKPEANVAACREAFEQTVF